MSDESDSFDVATLDAFARLVERLERGEPIDVDGEASSSCVNAVDLRELLARRERLERAFEALESREVELATIRAQIVGLESSDEPRYELLERVGFGGMGEVWRALDRRTGREIAIKRLRDTLTAQPAAVLRFVEEARLSAALEHPGIVAVHDVGFDEDGRAYFTMPLVRGESLASILENSPATSTPRIFVLEILLKVCDALAFAHARDVVHRDLKPANVMVGDFGAVFVLDWGLARALERMEAPEGVVGTPAYMSPEQARGERVDASTDVYGVGAMLWHAVAGRRPYAEVGDDADAVLAALRERGPIASALAKAAPELAAIAHKALERERDRRYASIVELADDLRAYLDGRVVRAHRVGAWPELFKWTKRNRALASTIAIALLAACGALVFFVQYRARKERELREFNDLSEVEGLEARLETFWPATPNLVQPIRDWLGAVAHVESRFHEHLEALREIESREVDGLLHTTPATREDGRRLAVLRELELRIARLRDPDPAIGGIASMQHRLEFASTIERRSVVEPRDAWSAALDDIDGSATYGELRFAPQMGLVPIGRDPESSLWEFAALASGAIPVRDERHELVIDEHSAIVLVLIPGGEFSIGSQAPVPGQPSTPITDKFARPDETPRVRVRLEAFFAAKHETTRAQWLRAMGGSIASDPLEPATLLSHGDAARAARRLGLSLPTEAQWERAARGDRESRYWTGDSPATLVGAANGRPVIDVRAVGSDVAAGPLRIGMLRSNAFGLKDVLGNVAEVDEWAGDERLESASESRPRLRRRRRCTARRGARRQLREPRAGLALRRALVRRARQPRRAHRRALRAHDRLDRAGEALRCARRHSSRTWIARESGSVSRISNRPASRAPSLRTHSTS